MYVESYKKLVVWQKAMTLVSEVYIFTKQLPEDERFNLISQMRRCAISVPSNIAEGYRRQGLGQYVQF